MSRAILSNSAHRPWSIPDRRWVMAMRWHDLLFAHWPLPATTLRPLLPRGLELDTFEGQAWIGVIPFRMSGVRLRCTPALPGPGAFPELNVRTYVSAGDKPGVWFFSLDARSRIAVAMARAWFHLPYYRAGMGIVPEEDDGIAYASRRVREEAEFVGRYWPDGPPSPPVPGTLEHWLTERYCLYASSPKGLLRGEIHHAPWPLQPARADIGWNTMTKPLGIELPDTEPLVHFARRLDVLAWSARPI